MKKIAVLILSLSALAAQAGESKLRPGLWEMSYQSEGLPQGMPQGLQLTPQQQAQMEKAGIKLGGNLNVGNIATQYCMTKEQAERNEPPRPRDSDKMKCEDPVYKRSGNSVSWKLVCTGERAVTSTGTMTISSPEAYSGNTTVTTKDSKHGEMTMSTKMQGKWLSDSCTKAK